MTHGEVRQAAIREQADKATIRMAKVLECATLAQAMAAGTVGFSPAEEAALDRLRRELWPPKPGEPAPLPPRNTEKAEAALAAPPTPPEVTYAMVELAARVIAPRVPACWCDDDWRVRKNKRCPQHGDGFDSWMKSYRRTARAALEAALGSEGGEG